MLIQASIYFIDNLFLSTKTLSFHKFDFCLPLSHLNYIIICIFLPTHQKNSVFFSWHFIQECNIFELSEQYIILIICRHQIIYIYMDKSTKTSYEIKSMKTGNMGWIAIEVQLNFLIFYEFIIKMYQMVWN